jgi:hypothetical protein
MPHSLVAVARGQGKLEIRQTIDSGDIQAKFANHGGVSLAWRLNTLLLSLPILAGTHAQVECQPELESVRCHGCSPMRDG